MPRRATKTAPQPPPPRHLVAADLPLPPSLPGGPSTHPGRAGVPAALGAEEEVAWDRVLRRTRQAEAQYRIPPSSAAASPLGPCADCDADCCSHRVVPVNVADVARLSSTLNLAPREFVTLVPWQAGWPVHRITWEGPHRALVLRTREDHSCAFLIRFGNVRRCGIHSLRPDACRVFPFLSDAARQQGKPGAPLLQLHPSHCPWRWPVSSDGRARLLADLADNTAHRDLDRAVLSAWNGPPREPEFFAFLDAALARLTAP